MGAALKRVWDFITKLDTIQSLGGWLWPAMVASVASAMTGVWAWIGGIPGPVIATLSLVAFCCVAICANQISAYRHRRFVMSGRPDTRIIYALLYVANQSLWADESDEYLSGAANEIRREALSGNVLIWGKRSISSISSFEYRFSNVHTLIASEYWHKNAISAEISLSKKDSNRAISETTMEEISQSDVYKHRYIDLMVNMSQIKHLWPPKTSRIKHLFLGYFNSLRSDRV